MPKKKFSLNIKNKNTQFYESNDAQKNDIKDLLKQLEILYSENYQLKELLSDLEKDLKDKDQSIEECQKLITKLKEEYSKVVNEFQQMEKSYNDLLDEISNKSYEIKCAQKKQSLINILQKKNDSLSNEKKNLHKENSIMRKKMLSCGNISIKIEKDIKSKDITIENLQTKNKNLIKMVKERENIIIEHSKKIKELNDIINNKNEELKIMINFSKEINKENKINVQELTKQAIKTIKTFQNNKNRNHSADYNNSKMCLSNIKSTFEDYEYIFKNNKITFYLEDAINDVMYIPDNLENVSKEFLINMNLKTELIKSELFSGLIRETQFISFIQKVLEKLPFNGNKGVSNIFQRIIEFKRKYINLIKENYRMKKTLAKITNINNKNNLNQQILKDNITKNNKIIKNKFIEKQNEIQKLKNEIKSLNNILITNNFQNNNRIQTSKHISFNNCKKRVKSLGGIIVTPNWNTLPSFEEIDINGSKTDNNKDNSLKKILFNKKSITAKSKRVTKKICQRANCRKKIINTISENQKEALNNLLYHQNSLGYNKSNKTENNKSQDVIIINNNYNNNSLKNEIKDKKKNNYKKEIFNLQNEINNILFKSLQNSHFNSNNIINSNNKTPKNNTIYIKLDNQIIKGKNKKIIFSDRIHKKKNSISSSENNNNMLNSQTSLYYKKGNFDKFESTDSNNFVDIKKHKKNCIFNTDFFINLFFKMNNIFDIFEHNKYKLNYNLLDISEIYLSFKKKCNELKNKTDEINYKINKSHILTQNNFTEKENLQSERRDFFDNSFKFFNQKIISLKKFEFECINMNEYVKNYLISQEITIQIMYKMGKKYIQFEPIEKLFNLFEDCLSYRMDEMNENIIFNRKLLIKLFKNQINCLFLSFEYNFN